MMTINFVTFENLLEVLPEDKTKGIDISPENDWGELSFITHDFARTHLAEYEITEDKRIYMKTEEGGIEEQSFTGELELIGGILLDEHDLEIKVNALFVRGNLEELTFGDFKKTDNSERIEAQKTFKEMFKEEEKAKKRWWYAPFNVWRSVVGFFLSVIRIILGFFIKICWKLQNLLT